MKVCNKYISYKNICNKLPNKIKALNYIKYFIKSC